MEEPRIKIDVHSHINIAFSPAIAGSLGEILTALRLMKDNMATLQETIAALTADDTELAADVTALVSIINDIPARIQAAVVDALTKAGVPDATVTEALNNVDNTVKLAIAEAKSVLPPSTGTDGQDTTGGGTTTDTVTGGQGADTIGGGTPTDTLVGGQGNDTVTVGNGNDTVADVGGTDTSVGGQGSDTVVDPTVPPPSGGSVPPASNAV